MSEARQRTPRVSVNDQLCFALHSTSRAIINAYRTRLAKLDLTYPQYLTLLAIWESDGQSVTELGATLHLDSGTLSPMLKRLEHKDFVLKQRSQQDERAVNVYVTATGRELEVQAAQVRREVEAATGLTSNEFHALRSMLHRVRESVESSG